MIDDVRKYLAQFEKATKEIITTEEKLYDHEAKTEKTIENIKKESQQFTMPILAELIKKKKERQAYEDKLKGKLVVCVKDLIAELNRYAKLDWFDKSVLRIGIDTQAGFITLDDLRNKIRNNASDLRNALSLTIKNEQYDVKRKFFIYKSMPLTEDIKFTDGSSIYDNIILEQEVDDYGRQLTKIRLTEQGEQNLMISFSPEDLVNKTYFVRPVELLKRCVINILDKNQTM